MTDNITVNTQSSIRIEAGKQILYVDPIEITEERHDADIIFITHEHGDHFSPEVLARLAHEETFFVAPALARLTKIALSIRSFLLAGCRPRWQR